MDGPPDREDASNASPQTHVINKQQRPKITPKHHFRAAVQKMRRALRSNRSTKGAIEQAETVSQVAAEMPSANAAVISHQNANNNTVEPPVPISEHAVNDEEIAQANRDALQDEIQKGLVQADEAAALNAEQANVFNVLGREVWNGDGTTAAPDDAQLEEELYAEMRAEGYSVAEPSNNVGVNDGMPDFDGLSDGEDDVGNDSNVDDIDDADPSNDNSLADEAADINDMLQQNVEIDSEIDAIDGDDIDGVDENGESHDDNYYMAMAQRQLRTAENMLRDNTDRHP